MPGYWDKLRRQKKGSISKKAGESDGKYESVQLQ